MAERRGIAAMVGRLDLVQRWAAWTKACHALGYSPDNLDRLRDLCGRSGGLTQGRCRRQLAARTTTRATVVCVHAPVPAGVDTPL